MTIIKVYRAPTADACFARFHFIVSLQLRQHIWDGRLSGHPGAGLSPIHDNEVEEVENDLYPQCLTRNGFLIGKGFRFALRRALHVLPHPYTRRSKAIEAIDPVGPIKGKKT
ncbi:MAG TPA: hypothetical protein VGB55_15680 [Tepidisphaeraceae bacterium]|jgi:hypothetical protein